MKDPKKVERRVTDLVQKEDYWTAFEEANRALREDACFDDTQIKEEFAKGQALLQTYQEQLVALDITPLHSTKYTQLLDEKARLLNDVQNANGIVCYSFA